MYKKSFKSYSHADAMNDYLNSDDSVYSEKNVRIFRI